MGEPGIRHAVRARAARTTSRTRSTSRSWPWLPAAGGCDIYAELRRQVLQLVPRPRRAPTTTSSPGPGSTATPWTCPPPTRRGRTRPVSPTQYAHPPGLGGGARSCRTGSGRTNRRASSTRCRSQEQPAMLDRAALEFCLADAFHPGCEVTWPIRHLTMYSSPVPHPPPPGRRARARLRNDAHPGDGAVAGRPAARPGAGRPDPVDGAALAGGHRRSAAPATHVESTTRSSRPSGRPACPNQVLTEPNYAVVIDTAKPPQDRRLAAFTERMVWTAPLDGRRPPSRWSRWSRSSGTWGWWRCGEGVAGRPGLPADDDGRVVRAGDAPQPPDAGPRRGAAAAEAAAPAAVEHAAEGAAQLAIREAGWSPRRRGAAPLPVRHPK